MKSRLASHLACLTVLGSTLLLATLLVTTGLPGREESDDVWISRHLSPGEQIHVQSLALEISRFDPQPSVERREILESHAAALSIRESAALGVLLSRRFQIDPIPWIRLAARREQLARTRLMKLYSRFESHEPHYPGLQLAVRGPQWLQRLCGDELLKEVTGVGFWRFYDSFIPAETDFSDADIDVLEGLPGLESIWAESSRLSDAGIARLAKLPRLCAYHLSGCTFLTDAAVRAVTGSSLKVLDLSRINTISDGGVRMLAASTQIEELRLGETGITSASLPTIARLRTLRTLTLGKTRVLTGLEQLQVLDQLHTLELSSLGRCDKPIPSNSLLCLSRFRQLRSLDLSETAIRRIVLQNLPELSELRLGHVSLKELSLRNLPRVRELQTGYPSDRQDIAIEEIDFAGLDQLTRLTLHCSGPAASNALAAGLADSSQLTDLYLPVVTMTDRLAESIGRHGALESLNLASNGISDSQAPMILQAPRLNRLKCGAQQLTQSGLHAIAESDHLEYLWLSRLQHTDPSCLTGSRSLKTLNLDEPDIETLVLDGDSNVTRIDVVQGWIGTLRCHGCEDLVNLSFLSTTIDRLTVDSCPKFERLFGGRTSLGAVHLNNLPNLEAVTIQEDSELRELLVSELPALRSWSFWAATIGLQPLKQLVGVPTLANLDVSNTQLTDDAAEIISRMSGLRRLTASPHFHRAGLMHLRQLPRLQELSLYRRDDADWKEAEARELFMTLQGFVVFRSVTP